MCDVTIIAPDAIAIVKDQQGNTLATESIPSGESKDININTGAGVLYTYPYDSFNTGQDVSYATGDDKDIRDTIFAPEIAAQIASGLQLVLPILDQTDSTKLLRGSNPDGSGTNIFGNLERFTDVLGNRWTENVTDYIIDHYSGLAFFTDRLQTVNASLVNALIFANNLTVFGYSDYFVPNSKIIYSLFNYTSFNRFIVNNQGAQGVSTSTTSYGNDLNYYIFLKAEAEIDSLNKGTNTDVFPFRKAFTYNPTTKEMELT